MQVVGQNKGGYLFSKSSRSGIRRYVSAPPPRPVTRLSLIRLDGVRCRCFAG
jgi:hypothetical protein